MKLQQLNLLHYLGLTLTSKWVGLILIGDFPSGPRSCHSKLPSPIFRTNNKLCLVQRLSVLWPMLHAPLLAPSLTNTYAIHEHIKLGVEPNPTFRFITQAHHKVVQTWAPFRWAPTLEGPFKRHVNNVLIWMPSQCTKQWCAFWIYEQVLPCSIRSHPWMTCILSWWPSLAIRTHPLDLCYNLDNGILQEIAPQCNTSPPLWSSKIHICSFEMILNQRYQCLYVTTNQTKKLVVFWSTIV